ncbi:hypothetical protein Fmac_031729 [Flemingia macrophylla]|uniref:Uncharacterized protein n=1 Tax=Flemingia macrophylla TaxID=520843 RepID=A0ABD1L3B4_9FABA
MRAMKQIHAHTITHDLGRFAFVANKLLVFDLGPCSYFCRGSNCVQSQRPMCGKMEEELSFVESMSMEVDGAIWVCLLNGCLLHGHVELANYIVAIVLFVPRLCRSLLPEVLPSLEDHQHDDAPSGLELTFIPNMYGVINITIVNLRSNPSKKPDTHLHSNPSNKPNTQHLKERFKVHKKSGGDQNDDGESEEHEQKLALGGCEKLFGSEKEEKRVVTVVGGLTVVVPGLVLRLEGGDAGDGEERWMYEIIMPTTKVAPTLLPLRSRKKKAEGTSAMHGVEKEKEKRSKIDEKSKKTSPKLRSGAQHQRKTCSGAPTTVFGALAPKTHASDVLMPISGTSASEMSKKNASFNFDAPAAGQNMGIRLQCLMKVIDFCLSFQMT